MTIVVVHDCLAVAVPKDLASFMNRVRYVGFKDVSPYIFQHTTFAQKQYQVGEIGDLTLGPWNLFESTDQKSYPFIRIVPTHQLQECVCVCVCVLQGITRSPMIGTYLVLTVVTPVLYRSMLADIR
jgi:hypothetical protein